ncbi:DUF6541 family protein [Paramicrobacterium agarici]|uniref:4-amino-4-deoxy-L-arabinose transferase-like glycosyltransferase n=1 Tax=Paramicrobacterium agarici TaxID=630514 RepID=A0A2A9DYY2_9MICO|nr:DUF6541 family protein [Microbacterium agarici]PFG31898.1 hypothetical protein ATJ78_2880 [Microbacterium agarici]
MTWLEAVPVVLIALLIIFVPGGLIAAAAGARRLLLALGAPAVTIALLAITAIVFAKVGVPWSLGPLTGTFVGVALITWLVRRWVTGTWSPVPDRRIIGFSWAFTVGLAIAAVIIALQLGFSFGAPDHVSQTYDAPFHLNGIQYIIDTANGSSFHLTGLILPAGRSTFYPAAWHDLVSVVAMAAPWAELVGVANMTNLVVASVVWPLGVLAVVRLLFPARRSALVIAGVAATAFPPFPLGMLDYGVLFSYFLALALLPAGLALGLSLFKLVRGRRLGAATLQILTLTCVVVAIGLSQPSVVFGLGLFGVVGLAALGVNAVRAARSNGVRIAWIVGIIVLLGAYALVWRRIGQFGYNAPWRDYGSLPEVLIDAFAFARGDRPLAVIIAIFVVVGIVAMIRRGRWWFCFMWLAAAGLFVLAGALPPGDLRNMTLGMFYKDTPRLEAFLVLPSLVLAVAGAEAAWGALRRRIPSTSPRTVTAIGVIGLLGLVAATQFTAMVYAVQHASNAYRLDERSRILDDDERALIERLPEEVPDDAVIVGNPWTGTSWAMAISDRRVLNPHFNTSHAEAHEIVNGKLNEAVDEAGVCDAIKATGARYVLDFGADRFDGSRLDVKTWIGFEGLLDLDESSAVEEVDREGDKVLYRITACGL